MCPESFAGFKFDLGPLLQGQMFFIPIMTYISPLLLVIEVLDVKTTYRKSGFGGKDDLIWEIICPECYGGVTFDLGPLL